MRVVFDAAIDASSWSGDVLQGHTATAGEAWLGPLGLLGRLELELGLAVRYATPLERAAELSHTLARVAGYWTRSLEVDPIATARRLLEDRDSLAMCGWSGERTSERLDSLWRITESSLAGIPERLKRVVEVLDRRRLSLSSIQVAEPLTQLSPLWQWTFGALARHGVQIEQISVPVVNAAGDLGAARHTPFSPVGDGTLQLLRTHGPLAAAEEVATTVAAANLNGLVIIGPDALLDAALVRHGLPSIGADVPTPASASAVRLCVEAAFRPMGSPDLHALLCLDPGPIPRATAWGLLRALDTFPSRDSKGWRDAYESGLALIENEDARAGVAARISALVNPVASRDGRITVDQLAERMRVLAGWARARSVSEPSLREVAVRADQLVVVARLCGATAYSRSEVLRFCDELECVVVEGGPARLGISTVHSPAAILGPAATVVWWGFTRDRGPRPRGLRLTREETAALSAAGVRHPDAGAEMAYEACRWRRALDLTTSAMVLVCPYTDAVGDRAHPHPLWDALIAAMPDPALASRLTTPRMTLPRTVARRIPAALRPIPAFFDSARTPVAIDLAPEESASNLELVLGCSLAYTLRRIGKLRPRMAARPSEASPLLYGNLTHHLLAIMFGGRLPIAANVAAHAEEIFDRELPGLAESLGLPDYQRERTSLRRAFVDTSRLLASIIAQGGATIRGLELAFSGTIAGVRVAARADLVLDTPFHVIDFKWGGSRQREQLRSGTSVQLAIYAALARGEDSVLPGVAYLTVRDQRLIAPRGTRLVSAEEIGTHTVTDMLEAVHRALEVRIQELAERKLAAPGAGGASLVRSRIVDGALRLAPPCQYCDFDTLCGRRRLS